MHDHVTDQLDEAVAEVFATMLDLRCLPVESLGFPSGVSSVRHLTASVRFSGSLTGFCAVQVDEPAAAGLTSQLTGISIDGLSPDLFFDTVAELCNMIAGCWKSMQPAAHASCNLSPPTPGSEPLLTSAFPRTFTRLYSCAPYQLTLALSVA